MLFSLLLSACQPTTSSTSPSPSEASATQAGSPLPATATAVGESSQSGSVEPTPFAELTVGQPFDQFIDDSFRMLMLRDPETLTIEGLSGMFGVRNDRLNDLSEPYIQETFALQRALYDVLRSYERASLTPAQQVTYDVYAWYLDDLIRGQDFRYNDYPVNFMYLLGQQYVTQALFTDYQPLTSATDAQDYLSRLWQVKPKFDQLIESLYQRQAAGLSAPRFVFEWSLGDVQGIGNTSAKSSAFYTTFNDKLSTLEGLSDDEKQALRDEALQAVEESVLPAYQALAETMRDLMKDAPQQEGVWQFANGEDYYKYALRHFTSTEMSADEIHDLGLSELERIHAEMNAIFNQLGYPEQNDLATNYRLLAGKSGLLQGEQILQRYEDLIATASQNLSPAFDIFPQAQVVVDRIPSGAAFYVSSALDGSRPGIFYAPVGGQQPAYKLPTVAYHEAIPGHHFQITLQREMDLPLMRNVITFNAYAEGWALYAERLAKELGWYDDDPYGDLGRLQYEAHRAARLVVDTGIHAKQWTFDQALDFMVENTGLDRSFLQTEVARYIVWPGQAASYYIGYLKLLELRQQAQAQLGDAFDLVEFHRVVLNAGSVPLDVLEDIVDAWLAR
jgi:uncharacterized protein (DUF885 family)